MKKEKFFEPFISDKRVIVDLEAKIDILVDDDVYLVSKNSKPLYFFDDSNNAAAFALLMYLDCIDCSFMTTDCLSLCNYFFKLDDLLTKTEVRQIIFPEDYKNE